MTSSAADLEVDADQDAASQDASNSDGTSESDGTPEPMTIKVLGDLNVPAPLITKVSKGLKKALTNFGNVLVDEFNFRKDLAKTFGIFKDFVKPERIQAFTNLLPTALEHLCDAIRQISNSDFFSKLAKNAKSIKDPSSAGDAFMLAADDLDFLQRLMPAAKSVLELLKSNGVVQIDEDGPCLSLLVDVPVLSMELGAQFMVKFGLSFVSSIMLVVPFCDGPTEEKTRPF